MHGGRGVDCEREGGRKGDKEGTGKEISEELKKAEGG